MWDYQVHRLTRKSDAAGFTDTVVSSSLVVGLVVEVAEKLTYDYNCSALQRLPPSKDSWNSIYMLYNRAFSRGMPRYTTYNFDFLESCSGRGGRGQAREARALIVLC